MAWSGDFLLLPGDSLELQRVADTRIPGLSSVRPRLAEVGRQDNACGFLLEEAFPYKSYPRVTDGDLGKYKSELEAFRQQKRDFLDSCRMRMTPFRRIRRPAAVAVRPRPLQQPLYGGRKGIRGGAALRDTWTVSGFRTA